LTSPAAALRNWKQARSWPIEARERSGLVVKIGWWETPRREVFAHCGRCGETLAVYPLPGPRLLQRMVRDHISTCPAVVNDTP
jgi:hypothetical protein